ncbi:MAG: tetratricopeptide repeat protein [Myxococcota bacterium]|nr:tetratricopeptide repeat protein [Myxococcota bacterium]
MVTYTQVRDGIIRDWHGLPVVDKHLFQGESRLSETYQIVGPDGQVSKPLAERSIRLALGAGRLLGSDRLKAADGSVTRVDSVDAFRAVINSSLSQAIDSTGLSFARFLAQTVAGAKAGHVVLIKPDTDPEAWSFVNGALVSVRPWLDSAPTGPDAEAKKQTAETIAHLIVNAFKVPSFKVYFFDDPTYAPQSPQVHFPMPGVIEVGLRSCMTDADMANHLDSLGNLGKGKSKLPDCLQPDRVDRQMLRGCLQYGASERATEALAKAIKWPVEQTRIRLMRLYVTGQFTSRGASLAELRRAETQLQGQSFFERLGVPTTADSAAIAAAYDKRIAELVGSSSAEGGEVRRLANSIQELLSVARRVLADDAQRAVYRRAQQSGADFNDPNVRDAMLRDHFLTQGKLLLDRSQYEDAKGLLESAVTHAPSEPRGHILLGWAEYLSSDESEEAANAAVARIRKALEFDRNSDEAYLYMGKICRLAGQKEDARRFLNQATRINNDNNEAWAQLRMVNTQKAARAGLNLDISVGQGVGPVLATAFFVLAGLYAGANLIEGGAKEWPMLEDGSQLNQVRQIKDMPAWMKKVQEKRQAEQTFDIPKAKQVVGNVESYMLPEDTWYWTRRGILLFMGLFGILGIAKRRFNDIKLIEKGGAWLFFGCLYGLVVGFLSPLPLTPTPLLPALGMVLTHTLAEQLFFFGFIGVALLDRIDNPLFAIVLTAALFGLHQLTFFATLSLPPSVMLTGVLQMTAFAGGVYAFLLWQTGGILAPIMAQLTIMSVMIVRCIQAYGG